MPCLKKTLYSTLLVGSIVHIAAQSTITLFAPVQTDAMSISEEDKGSLILSAIGTGSDGTTYVEKQVETVVYEVHYASPLSESRIVTSASHISPITLEATVVVDATHMSYNFEGKLYPAETDAPDTNYHEIQNCNFDSSGSGTCVDVIAISTGSNPTTTYMQTTTWSGPGRAWATITAQSQNGARRDGMIGVGAAGGLALFVAGGMMFGAAFALM